MRNLVGHPFQHCPSCGAPGLQRTPRQEHRFTCPVCAFVFFHNTAAACGAILRRRREILLLRRRTAPGKGMLDFPGGFIDPGESAEVALVREIREEIGVVARDLEYLTSEPNRYHYGGVTYNTCDLIFTGELPAGPLKIQESEVAGFELVPLEAVAQRLEEIAFPSLRRAMALFLERERLTPPR